MWHREWEQETEKKDNIVGTQRFQIALYSVLEYKIAIFNMANKREVWKYKQGTWDQPSKVKNTF